MKIFEFLKKFFMNVFRLKMDMLTVHTLTMTAQIIELDQFTSINLEHTLVDSVTDQPAKPLS